MAGSRPTKRSSTRARCSARNCRRRVARPLRRCFRQRRSTNLETLEEHDDGSAAESAWRDVGNTPGTPERDLAGLGRSRRGRRSGRAHPSPRRGSLRRHVRLARQGGAGIDRARYDRPHRLDDQADRRRCRADPRRRRPDPPLRSDRPLAPGTGEPDGTARPARPARRPLSLATPRHAACSVRSVVNPVALFVLVSAPLCVSASPRLCGDRPYVPSATPRVRPRRLTSGPIVSPCASTVKRTTP